MGGSVAATSSDLILAPDSRADVLGFAYDDAFLLEGVFNSVSEVAAAGGSILKIELCMLRESELDRARRPSILLLLIGVKSGSQRCRLINIQSSKEHVLPT